MHHATLHPRHAAMLQCCIGSEWQSIQDASVACIVLRPSKPLRTRTLATSANVQQTDSSADFSRCSWFFRFFLQCCSTFHDTFFASGHKSTLSFKNLIMRVLGTQSQTVEVSVLMGARVLPEMPDPEDPLSCCFVVSKAKEKFSIRVIFSTTTMPATIMAVVAIDGQPLKYRYWIKCTKSIQLHVFHHSLAG